MKSNLQRSKKEKTGVAENSQSSDYSNLFRYIALSTVIGARQVAGALGELAPNESRSHEIQTNYNK